MHGQALIRERLAVELGRAEAFRLIAADLLAATWTEDISELFRRYHRLEAEATARAELLRNQLEIQT